MQLVRAAAAGSWLLLLAVLALLLADHIIIVHASSDSSESSPAYTYAARFHNNHYRPVTHPHSGHSSRRRMGGVSSVGTIGRCSKTFQSSDKTKRKIPLPASEAVVFTVKTNNEAHLEFFSGKRDDTAVYEIVISGWETLTSGLVKYHSVIKKTTGGRSTFIKGSRKGVF